MYGHNGLDDVTRRRALARHLRGKRDELVRDLAPATAAPHDASLRLMMRALSIATADAIERLEPAPLVAWAQLTATVQPAELVASATTAICSVAAGLGEQFGLDGGRLVVFLEIAQAKVSGAIGRAGRAQESETIETLLTLLRARDEATCEHSYATGTWCRRLGEALGLRPTVTAQIARAGVLHDVGKINTPDSILLKTGPLSADEWLIMQRHAAFGATVLAEIPSLASYAPIVRAHHERIDGTGYPDGLAGDEIPYEARVLSVADAFHAMVSDRSYRKALSYSEAMDALRVGRGTQWQADIVDTMIALAAEHRSRALDDCVAAASHLPSDEGPSAIISATA